MKTIKLKTLTLVSLATLAFAVASTNVVRAELKSEEVQEEAIVPEQTSAVEQELKPLAKKKIIVKEEEDLPAPQMSISTPSAAQAKSKSNAQNWNNLENSNSQGQGQETSIVPTQTVVVEQAHANTQGQATESAQAQGQKASFGSRMDQGMQNKMDDLKGQYEDALLRQLDKIKITVDDGSKAEVNVVQDQVINTNAAAAGYVSIEKAPSIKDDSEEEGTESVAKVEEQETGSRIRLSPVIGYTSINSDAYKIDARYTAGFSLEMELTDNLAGVLGYSYSQYDVSLGSNNPFFSYNQPILFGANQTTLQYNQNLFEGGLRFYLFPRDSKFRVHVGGGLGYNKGYLNYRSGVFSTYAYNPYTNLQDYEVTSYLGIMETGAEFAVSKNVAIGGLFKYANVLSSSENQPLNNYGFAQNGYGTSVSPDQRVVGGSIAENGFYSILGTVKVSF